ncbi:MAG: hypothetical protein ABIE14_04550 [Patescibacteria group bacterium]
MRKFHCLLAKISRWLLPVLPAIGALALVAIFAEPALAAEVGDFSKWTGPVALILSGVIMIIVLFAFIFAIFLGDLMDSTYILDSGMGDTLHLIWEVMRNFVNVGFILILLIIAAMVIFGGGGERGLGLLKKVLPKFVLALILVNFTFFAARFVLTTNDVLATAIFSLPRTISGEQKIRMPCNPDDSANRSCLDQIKDTMKTAAKGNEAASEKIAAITKAITAKTEDGSPRWFPQTVKQLSLGKKNMSLVLLSSMIDLEHILHTKGVAGDGSDLAIAAIGTLIVAGAVGIIFFMLFLAFVVRMVVLWVAIAISPLAALGIVLKELIPGLDMGKGGFDPVKVFISHAFMPTMVAIPLSIGMIMIFANNAVGFDMSTGWIKSFSGESGDIHALLWWIASIIVIWFGTNKMIKEASPDFAAKLTDGIHGGVNKFVGAAAGTLKYAPMIPAWSAPMTALNRMQTAGQNRHAAAGEDLLKGSGIDKEWYTAPATISQVKTKVNEVGSSENKDDALKKLEKLLRYLFESSNGKKMLSQEVQPDRVLEIKQILGVQGDIKARELGGIISHIADAETVGLDPKEKYRLHTLMQMVESGEDQELESVPDRRKAEDGLVKNTTGLTYLTADQLKDKTINKETGFVKNGKEVFEVEVEGKGKVLFTPTDKDDLSKGGAVEESRNDLMERLQTLNTSIKMSEDGKEFRALAKEIDNLRDEYGEGVLKEIGKLEFSKTAGISGKFADWLKGYKIEIDGSSLMKNIENKG